MKKGIKTVVATLVLCAGVLSLSACGGKSDSNKKENNTTQTTEEVTEEKTTKKQREKVEPTTEEPVVYDEAVVGTWAWEEDGVVCTYGFDEGGSGTYTIEADGESESMNLTYITKDNTLFITYDEDGDVFEMGYKVEESALVLTDSFDDEYTYNKK